MQETASSLVSDILREIYVQGDEQSIESVDFETCIRYINRFMAELGSRGIDIPWVPLSSPNDPVYAPDGVISAIIANVAVRLAGQYDVQISEPLAASAALGMDALMMEGVNINKQRYPSTLPVGSGNDDWYNGNSRFFPDYNEDENGPY